MYQNINVIAVTNKGNRDENQDNFRIDTEISYIVEDNKCVSAVIEADDKIHIVCVCDGIGGASLGKAVTISALDIISSFLEKQELELTEFVEKIVNKMAKNIGQIFEKIREEGGTTLALLAWKGDDFYAVNIGDSPIYRICDDIIEELSEEHTLARYKLANKLIPSEGDENILLNYIGRKDISGKQMMHGIAGKLKVGDCFFLCSDGVAKVFDNEQIKKQVLTKKADSVETIVEQASNAKYSDNCTAMLLTVK